MLRRFCLWLGFNRTTPSSPGELFLLSSILGIEARDLGVTISGTADDFLKAAQQERPDRIAELQHRIREELAHRRQAVGAIFAIVAAISAVYSATSSSRSAATAQAAVNIILKR